VDVTYPGPYNVTTDTAIDGMIFSANGYFTTTGTQLLTLYGSGKPTTAGGINFVVYGGFNTNGVGNNCSFLVPVKAVSTGGPATFSIGSSSACTGFSSTGTYTSGVALTSANTAAIQVNVTAVGTYAISTTTVDGIYFKASGTFTSTGTNTVTLTGNGTPTAAGTFPYSVSAASGGAGTCPLSITVAQGAAPGTYSLVSASGNCSGFVANGTYTSGTALTSSNTVTAQVNVTTIGSYSISTGAAANGISFSASGTFTTTGTQLVTLTGSGTPTTAGTSNYTATAGSSTCMFSITVAQGTAPGGTITCTIAGTSTTFNSNATASIDPTLGLTISGYISESTEPNEMLLNVDKLTGGSVGAGTYVNTVAAVSTQFYTVSATYTDNSNTLWSPASAATAVFGGTPDPFTIVITSITATEVKGTFSGTVRNNSGSGTSTMAIASGTFDVPIQ
jgi:hypothetical protein